MKKNKSQLITILMMSAVLAFTSCGGDDDDNDRNVSNGSNDQQEEQIDQGNYEVVLQPLNPNVVLVNGEGNFSIIGDELSARVVLGDSMATRHIQQIHIGIRCPGAEDDTNSDGYIDVIESKVAVKNPLIPLDDDLSSQSSGGIFPIGPFVNYLETTSYATLMADLYLPDTNTSDELIKLDFGENLNLDGKTILIHGVSLATELPSTVQTLNGLTSQESLPILCGVIQKVQTGTTTSEI